MELSKIIEILKIVLGWPVIILFIIFLLRKQLVQLIERIGKAKVGSTEFEFVPEPPSEKLSEIKRDIEKKVNGKDPRLLQVAVRFEYWLNTYDHHGDTPSESFRKFITADKAIVEYGVTYDEYRQLSEILRDRGIKIDYVIPESAFRDQFELSRERIRRYSFL